MKPPEAAHRDLVSQWVAKANRDFDAAVRLLAERDARFREIAGFLCQQAAEKYLKAFLVRHEVEFPKTHDIGKLLNLVAAIDPVRAESLRDAEYLTPFGVEARYPGDSPDALPGGEKTVVELAEAVKNSVTVALTPYLSGE